MWHAVDDIEKGNVTQLFQSGEVGKRSADMARPDQSDFIARHLWSLANATLLTATPVFLVREDAKQVFLIFAARFERRFA